MDNNNNSNVYIPKKLDILWTPKQAAEYFSVKESAIYRWIKNGKVFDPNNIKRINGKIRIPRSEVERVAGVKQEEIKNNL